MFSVKNRSNIRQVTPFADFGPYEAKTFYPISKIYASALAFFEQKPQFEVFKESLPVEVKVEQKPVQPVKPTEPVNPPATEEKSKQEEAEPKKPETSEEKTPEAPASEEKTPEAPATEEKPAETPVVTEKKPKARRSL